MGSFQQAFEGILDNVERRFTETQSDASRKELEEFMTQCPCPTCQGRRLKKEALAVTVGGMDIDTFCHQSVTEALDFVDHLTLTETQAQIAQQILKEIKGPAHLPPAGGAGLPHPQPPGRHPLRESQRIRLATQIGSSPHGGAVHSGRALHRPPPAG